MGGGGPLACDSDGAGIGGFNFDEIDDGDDGQEELTLDFSETPPLLAFRKSSCACLFGGKHQVSRETNETVLSRPREGAPVSEPLIVVENSILVVLSGVTVRVCMVIERRRAGTWRGAFVLESKPNR
jgi:hypothetical protein